MSEYDNHEGNGKDYEKRSRRIYAWSDLLNSLYKFLLLIVIIVALGVVGKMFVFKSSKTTIQKHIKKPVLEKIDWSKIDKAVEKTMREARLKTEKLASGKLDLWINKNMDRVDNDFLDWYFGYWTQQGLGIKGLLAQVMHWVDDDNPTAAERITQVVQQEFTTRVIRPQIAQLEMERLIDELIVFYSNTLKGKLEQIPTEYKISPADWDRYIGDISVMIKSVEANRSTSIPIKALVGVSTGGAVLVINSLKPVISKIGGKISSKLAGKAAAKMAAKTGGKVAAKTGGKFLGTIIAVGIIVWDVWDHYSTKKKAKPVLRQNILDYLKEVKQSILNDPSFGIMTILYGMEKSISNQLKTT
ncbi:MAG: hypothetical protein GY757_34110 [bacterium]|nr:hypothetical protein [bacterium]